MGQLTRGHRGVLRTGRDQLAAWRANVKRPPEVGAVAASSAAWSSGRQDPLEGRVLGAVVEEGPGARPLQPVGPERRAELQHPLGDLQPALGPVVEQPTDQRQGGRADRLGLLPARRPAGGQRHLVGWQVGQGRQAVARLPCRSWVATSWWSP